MFENLIEILKKNPRKIVYTEGTDARILESAARLKQDGYLTRSLSASRRMSWPRRKPAVSTSGGSRF
jgi:phosphotransacetylase